MAPSPFSDLEWRARNWLSSQDTTAIVRFLAYVPLFITPPVGAIALALYLKKRGGMTEDAYRHMQTSILIAAANIVLSAVILYNGGQYLGSQLQSIQMPFSDILTPAPQKPPYMEIKS